MWRRVTELESCLSTLSQEILAEAPHLLGSRFSHLDDSPTYPTFTCEEGDTPDGMSMGSRMCSVKFLEKLTLGQACGMTRNWKSSLGAIHRVNLAVLGGGILSWGRWGAMEGFRAEQGPETPAEKGDDHLGQGDGDNTDQSIAEKQGARGSRGGTRTLISGGTQIKSAKVLPN